MTIEKLPSGIYRIREMKNGKRYSVTVPFKPTKREAFDILQEYKTGKHSNVSFGSACETYIASKSHILSPSTLKEYKSTVKNLPDDLKAMPVDAVDNRTVQEYINAYSADHAPKSVRNRYGFIHAVLLFYDPDTKVSASLPQKIPHDGYVPTIEDIKRILEYDRDSIFYVPLYLATLSCRLSEICALTLDDLHGNMLTINKAKVQSENGYVVKPVAKTDASNRTIAIPAELADRIRSQGFIYPYAPRNVYKHLKRIQKKLGIPEFGVHRLRHFFASYSHDLGYSDAVIQSVGGWNTPHVMKSVYRHAMNEDDAKKTMASDFKF